MADGTKASTKVSFVSPMFPVITKLLNFIIKERYYKKKLKDIAV